MRKIKKNIIVIITAFCAFTTAACGNAANETQSSSLPQTVSTRGAADKVPDPNAPILTIVSIYEINKDGVGLNQKMDALDSDTLNIDEMWKKLKEYKIVPDDSEILSFNISDNKGVLDVSSLNRENKYIAALGNALVENFSLTELDIKLNGESIVSDFEFNTNYKKVE